MTSPLLSHLGEADAVALSERAAQMANTEAAADHYRRVSEDRDEENRLLSLHLSHVTGHFPHWYVQHELDGWHPHLQTYDPVHGIRDTQHVEPTEERAWAWLERAVEVLR